MPRVQKLLSNYGYCSRRKAEELIIAGRVRVNDTVITIGDSAEETDRIFVDGVPVKKPQRIYLMFHKPVGCVTAATDPVFRTVMDYVKENVFPVGRLDYNTSGLLLLTNDGDFANKVAHPRYEVNKTYEAYLDRRLEPQHKKQIESGVRLSDGVTEPARVAARENHVSITIHEGKNRIIRRMLKELGYYPRRLKRIRIGNLSMGSLKPGSYRRLSSDEIARIWQKYK
ncbi:MAG: pseudouridine synthase [archaeon]